MRNICPECEVGKHGNCNGQAWDHDADARTICQCPDRSHPPLALSLIAEDYAGRDSKLLSVSHADLDKIRGLLLGRMVQVAARDHLVLDNGTLLKIIPNQGGCACSAGDYDLKALNGTENVITAVDFDYHPTGDDVPYDPMRPPGHYRIFVLAGNKIINLVDIEGDDGNGYYGTGYSILVRQAV